MSTQRTLVIFSDYACPYCYLAEREVARLTRDTDLDVAIAAFELRPAGTPLPTPDEPWLREGWTRSVQPLARELGEDIAFPGVMSRTRKAHEAVAHARALGAGTAMHAAVFRAYWREGRDIGRIDVLMELGAEAGLDGTALKVALDIDRWTERVELDEAWAAQLGVRAVPAYLLTTVDGGDPAEPAAIGSSAFRSAGLAVAGTIRAGLLRHEQLAEWVTEDDDI